MGSLGAAAAKKAAWSRPSQNDKREESAMAAKDVRLARMPASGCSVVSTPGRA